MSYGKKWFAEFFDKAGQKVTVELLKKDYTLMAQPLQTYSNNPLSSRILASNKEEYNVVNGSSYEFTFLATDKVLTGENIITQFSDLFESGYRDWMMIIKVDESEKWRGYVQPDMMSHEFLANAYQIRVRATDALKDLKNEKFLNVRTSELFQKRQKIISVLRNAILPIHIKLDFRVQMNLRHEGGDSNVCAFLDTYVDVTRFQDPETGEYNDCHTVIEKLLSPFLCTLRQSDGKYWIQSVAEGETPYWEITWDPPYTSEKKSALDPVIIDESDYINRGEITKVSPVREINLVQRQRYLGSDAGVDLSNLTNWSVNAPAGIIMDASDGIFTIAAPDGAFSPPPNIEISLETETVTISEIFADKEFFVFSFIQQMIDHINASVTFRIGVYYNGSLRGYTQVSGVSGTPNGWEAPHEDELFAILEPGNYKFKIDILATSLIALEPGTPYFFEFEMYGFDLKINRGDVDQLFDVRQVGRQPGKRNVEYDIYLQDSDDADHINAFTYIDQIHKPTTTWTRGSGSKPIAEHFIDDYLRLFQAYKSSISLRVSGEEIQTHNYISLDGVLYKIQSYTKSYHKLTTELSVLKHETSEVTPVKYTNPEKTSDGVLPFPEVQFPFELEQANEAEVQEIQSETVETLELETEQPNEAELEAANEADLEAANEAELEALNEAELEAANEAELESINEAEIEAANEAELQVANEAELESANEAELETANEAELEAANEAELEAANEAELEALNEAELEAANEAEIEQVNEAEVQEIQSETVETLELQTEQTSEAEIESANEAELEQASEAELEALNEAELEAANEAELESANQAELEQANEADLEAANEAQLEAAHEAEIEDVETLELQTEQPNEAELEAASEAELESANEAELEALNEAELEAANEAELESANQAELEQVNEAELEAANEAQLEAAHEAEIEDIETLELETEQPSEAELEQANEADLEQANEAEVEVVNEAELEAINEADLELANEAEVETANEANLETANEADLEQTNEAELEQANEAETETANQAELEQAYEAEIEGVETLELETEQAEEAELEAANEAGLEQANEAELEHANEAVLEQANEAELESANEAEIQAANEADLEQANEAELEQANQAELEQANEAELEAANEAQLEAAHEAEIEDVETLQLQTEQPNEAELEAANEAELESANEAELEALNEAELEAANEAELESANQAELEQANEADLEAANEAELEAANEAELETVNESELEAANEAELEQAHEAEIEDVETIELETEYPNEAELEQANEAELESANEAELESALEAELESANESELEAANEAELQAANEAELEAANEAEVEELETETLSRDDITFELEDQLMQIISSMQLSINQLVEEVFDIESNNPVLTLQTDPDLPRLHVAGGGTSPGSTGTFLIATWDSVRPEMTFTGWSVVSGGITTADILSQKQIQVTIEEDTVLQANWQ